MLGDSNDDV